MDELINLNPNVDEKQMADMSKLAEKLKDIPMGKQRPPSPLMRRRIKLVEDAAERRTIRLTTRRLNIR